MLQRKRKFDIRELAKFFFGRLKLPEFCRIFPIRPRRNVRGPGRVPTGSPQGPGRVPTGSPQFAFSRNASHTAPPKVSARSCARPQAAALRDLTPLRVSTEADVDLTFLCHHGPSLQVLRCQIMVAHLATSLTDGKKP